MTEPDLALLTLAAQDWSHCATCPKPIGRPSYCRGCPCQAAKTGKCLRPVKSPAQMTPQEIAEHGIPLEVALRSSVEALQAEIDDRYRRGDTTYPASRALDAYTRCLAILEAQRE